jgi:hypothetical protein
LAALVYEKLEDKENAIEYLEKSIKNAQTLSLSVKKVQEELKKLK